MKKNDPVSEDIDVEENGSLGEEGIFVTENRRKHQSSVTKAITYAAIGLAVVGTTFATGHGITDSIRSAAPSSKNPEAESVAARLARRTAAEEAAEAVRPFIYRL